MDILLAMSAGAGTFLESAFSSSAPSGPTQRRRARDADSLRTKLFLYAAPCAQEALAFLWCTKFEVFWAWSDRTVPSRLHCSTIAGLRPVVFMVSFVSVPLSSAISLLAVRRRRERLLPAGRAFVAPTLIKSTEGQSVGFSLRGF